MTTLRPYPTYVDHRSPTFDRLPQGWQAIKARHLVRIRTGSGDTVDSDPDGKFPFYVRSEHPLRSDHWEFDTTAVLTAGDGAGVAKVFHLVHGRFMAHQRVYVLDDFRHVTPRFFYYAFSSLFHLMALDGSAKSTVDSVRRPMIADMPMPVPSLAQQHEILLFLDRETSQIDDLIAEQQRLVELLGERRAAAVDRVVWRGLNSAPTAATGVDPAPHSPSHWRRLRNKDLFFEATELSREGHEELLTVSHLTGITPRSEKNVNMIESESLEGYRVVRPGDLVINTMWAWMGALGVSSIAGLVSPAYGVYRPRSGAEVNSSYFDYLYRSRPYVMEMTRHSRGIWESRLRLYPETFLRLPIVVPPLDEQRAIVDYLDAETARIDELIREAEQLVGLARERRSALITAAVTGKIDLRRAN